MRNSQNGFGAIEVIVVLVIVLIIGFAGWFVSQSRSNIKSSNSSNSTSTKSGSTSATSEKQVGIDTMVTDIDPITLDSVDDIDTLPAVVPTSFKTYFTEKLQNNAPDADGCISSYAITKISQVNIRGGGMSQSTVPGASEFACGSGAPLIWVVTPDGTWDQVSLNDAVCKSKGGGLIYEEFVPDCFVEGNPSQPVKNPNGSITTLGR